MDKSTQPAPVSAETAPPPLLPCPFCGANAELTNEFGILSIICDGACRFSLYGYEDATPLCDLIGVWNRRATASEIESRLRDIVDRQNVVIRKLRAQLAAVEARSA